MCVGGAECDFEVSAFEDVCDVGSFLTDICEASPFSGGVVSYLFVSVGGLCDFIGKELLCRMLCIMLCSYCYSFWLKS